MNYPQRIFECVIDLAEHARVEKECGGFGNGDSGIEHISYYPEEFEKRFHVLRRYDRDMQS